MTVFWKLIPMLVVAAIVGGCGTVGRTQGGIENFDEVTPSLFRGAQPTAEGFKSLATNNHVKTVINLCDGDNPREAELVRAQGMAYVGLPLDADTVTPADGEKFLELLAKAEGPVFVHCHAGRDRTGLAVAAYRMRIQKWTRDAAIKDLMVHGYNWMLFPKVRESVVALAVMPLNDSMASAVKEGVKSPGAN